MVAATGGMLAELNRLGVSKVDLVIASHNHADRIGGLAAVLERFRPRFYMDNAFRPRVDKKRGRGADVPNHWLVNYDQVHAVTDRWRLADSAGTLGSGSACQSTPMSGSDELETTSHRVSPTVTEHQNGYCWRHFSHRPTADVIGLVLNTD